MNDPLHFSLSLGRFFGIHVRLHVTLLAYFAFQLVKSAVEKDHAVFQTAAWLSLLLLAVLVHAFGHYLASRFYYEEPEDIRLWPLGDFQLPGWSLDIPSENAWRISLAGPLLNLVVCLAVALGLYVFADAIVTYRIFGNDLGTGAPEVAAKAGEVRTIAQAYTGAWWLGWFAYWNWVLFVVNLIPALPFDGGRLLRTSTLHAGFGSPRHSLFVPIVARTVVVLLVVIGFFKMVNSQFDDGLCLWMIALIVEMISRAESRQDEESDENQPFGYDFSQGYISLESNAATVRPRQENAIERWRRRRSEQRRIRRQAREAAQSRRMDEILEKIHREGKASLTDEETRFLNRVSRSLRKKPKNSNDR